MPDVTPQQIVERLPTALSDAGSLKTTLAEELPAGNEIIGDVGLVSPLTAFGELLTAPNTPVVQVDFVYGLLSDRTATYSGSGGSVSAANNLLTCSLGKAEGRHIDMTPFGSVLEPGETLTVVAKAVSNVAGADLDAGICWVED